MSVSETVNADMKEILFHADTISQLRQIVSCTRIYDQQRTFMLLEKIRENLQKTADACVADGCCDGQTMQMFMHEMFQTEDIIQLGDMLECKLIPVLEDFIQRKNALEMQVDGHNRLEATASGFFTIQNTDVHIYLHSNTDPMDEARETVEREYDPQKTRYLIWGCGLGYHIYQLYRISEGRIRFRVYEQNPSMIEYARTYGVLSWVPEDVLEFVCPKDTQQYVDDETAEDGLYFLIQAVSTIPDLMQRCILERRYYQWNFQYESIHQVKISFNRNRELKLPDISQLDRSLVKKDMVIIAGGPSVNEAIETLRQWKGRKTLIAVGTIWKRLLREGIVPDFAVIMDPYEMVLGQVEGIEETSTILLLAMQAYWKIARCYKGPIYTICNTCPGSGMEEYARQNGLDEWFAGASVTVLALEFAVRYYADRVYLVGADMAYPGGASHADGTIDQHVVDTAGMIPVMGMDGQTVYSDNLLETFRAWMELIMSATEGIEYINMSKHGAVIKGARAYRDSDF